MPRTPRSHGTEQAVRGAQASPAAPGTQPSSHVPLSVDQHSLPSASSAAGSVSLQPSALRSTSSGAQPPPIQQWASNTDQNYQRGASPTFSVPLEIAERAVAVPLEIAHASRAPSTADQRTAPYPFVGPGEGRAAIISGLPAPISSIQEPQAPPRKSAAGDPKP